MHILKFISIKTFVKLNNWSPKINNCRYIFEIEDHVSEIYLEKITRVVGVEHCMRILSNWALDDKRYSPHTSVWKLDYNRHPDHLNPTLIAQFGPTSSSSYTSPQFRCTLRVVDPLGVIERDFEAELRRTLIVEVGGSLYSATNPRVEN